MTDPDRSLEELTREMLTEVTKTTRRRQTPPGTAVVALVIYGCITACVVAATVAFVAWIWP